MSITLYGIKNCDTVKKARGWLDNRKVDYRFHDFRAEAISKSQIEKWIADIGLETFVNKRSTTWKELDEDIKNSFSSVSAVSIIMDNPTLIKRPLLDTGRQKLVGFNEAEYVKIFN